MIEAQPRLFEPQASKSVTSLARWEGKARVGARRSVVDVKKSEQSEGALGRPLLLKSPQSTRSAATGPRVLPTEGRETPPPRFI
jgi:hypothetical protein